MSTPRVQNRFLRSWPCKHVLNCIFTASISLFLSAVCKKQPHYSTSFVIVIVAMVTKCMALGLAALCYPPAHIIPSSHNTAVGMPPPVLCVNHGISAEAAPVVTRTGAAQPELTVRVSGPLVGPGCRHREHAQMRITQRVLKIFPHTQIQVREGLGAS